MEKTSFLCPELLECHACEEQYEAKVKIENCVRMFMKVTFGEIFKRKFVKYPQRKFMKLLLLKIRKLLTIKMKKVT